MTGNMPLIIYMSLGVLTGLVYLVFFFGIFFIGGIDHFKPGEMKTRFSDVWGQDQVLHKVRENVDFLERPAEIEAKGGYVPGGILLWGPPGTGKTLMAEAVAGETGKPYTFVDPSAFIQTFMGVAPMKVKSLYRKLRKQALKHGGVVVFFDEADALGNRGALNQGGWNNARRDAAQAWEAMASCNGLHYVGPSATAALWDEHLASHSPSLPEKGKKRIFIAPTGGAGGASGALQALLTEMSGLAKPRGFFSRRIRSFLCIRQKKPPKYRILHIMATNMPSALDEALLRPGRIDRIYKVGYPSLEGRKRTFEGYLAKVRHELTDADVERLSTISPYATGAVIKDMVNEALIIAMRDGRDVITWPDMLRAKQIKTHGMPDDSTYGELERHAVAIHEASHAVAMYRLQRRHTIDLATIERRGDIGGFVNNIPVEERFFEWRSERENDVVTFLASLAGERMFFDGDNSAGVGGDLRAATSIITQMHGYAAMGDTLASLSVDAAVQGPTSRNEFGRGVEVKLQEMLQRARVLLDENRTYVLAIAHALETYKTISGEDIDAIFKGTRGPVVDGTVYHSGDFPLSYEAYHLQALEAHRKQVKVDVALPVLRRRVPVGAGNGNGHALPWAPPTVPGNGRGNGRHGGGW